MDNSSQNGSNSPESLDEPTDFPTSAAPIFQRVGLLVAAIIGLCVLSYTCTSEPKTLESGISDTR